MSVYNPLKPLLRLVLLPMAKCVNFLTRLLPEHVPIAFKLAFIITFLVFCGMLLIGHQALLNQKQMMTAQFRELSSILASQLVQSISNVSPTVEAVDLQALTESVMMHGPVVGVAIVASDNREVSQSGVQSPLLDAQSSNTAGGFLWGDSENNRFFSFYSPITVEPYQYAVVTVSALQLERAERAALLSLVKWTGLMIVLATLLALYMSRRASESIQKLMEATRAIDQGNLGVRIPERRNDEIGRLIAGFNNMADGLLHKSQVEQIFSRYVSKNVADQILASMDQVQIGSRHVNASVLFADIVGFTAMSERLQPGEISALLNEYFGHISTACRLYGGMVDKFIGDCVMLVFGMLEDDEHHSFHAVCCALLIRQLAEHLNAERVKRGLPVVRFRIGINAGSMLAGNLGSDERMEYTVVGDAVNLASRLCYVAKPDQIIVRDELIEGLRNSDDVVVSPIGTIALRGKTKPVTVFNVEDLHAKHHQQMQQYLQEALTGQHSVGDQLKYKKRC